MTEQRQGVGKEAGCLCRGWSRLRNTRERFSRQKLVVLVTWTPTYLCTGTGLAMVIALGAFWVSHSQDLEILSSCRLLYLQRVALCCPQSASEPAPSLFTSVSKNPSCTCEHVAAHLCSLPERGVKDREGAALGQGVLGLVPGGSATAPPHDLE